MLVPSMISLCLWAAEGSVLVLNHNKLGHASRQDDYSIGQDRMCVQERDQVSGQQRS